jgi:hypothetical protein
MNMNEFFTNLQDQPWILLPVAAVVGYLLGSISTARVIYFLSTGSRDYTPFTEVNSAGEEYEVDLVSATWVSKKLGKRYGCFTAVLDMLKVGLPTLLFKLLFTAHPYFLLVALAGMAGHNYPPLPWVQGRPGGITHDWCLARYKLVRADSGQWGGQRAGLYPRQHHGIEMEFLFSTYFLVLVLFPGYLLRSFHVIGQFPVLVFHA